MANQNIGSRILITPIFRMSYPTLIEPKRYKDQKTGKEKGDPFYSLEAIFNKEDGKKFQMRDPETGKQEPCSILEAMHLIAEEFWPGEDFKTLFKESGGKRTVWISGDKKADEIEKRKGNRPEHYEGKMLIPLKASGEYPPKLSLIHQGKSRELVREFDEKGKIVKTDDVKLAESLFKAGSYAAATINIKCLEVDGKKYITAYMNSVMFAREGASLGRSGADLDALAGVVGGESDYDPSADDDDYDI